MSEENSEGKNDWLKWSIITSIIFAYALHGYLVGDLFVPGNARYGGVHGGAHLTGEKALHLTIVSAGLVIAGPFLFLKHKFPHARWVAPAFLGILITDLCYFLYGLIKNTQF
jgi:hypothetical protein